MVCSGTFIMVNNLPNLRILPLNDLILHEDHDRQRTLPLVAKLRAQGILRNPPIVMPLDDGTGRYMVLDGANRVTSLQEMEFPHIVAQVVQANDPHVNLQTWNHVIWGMSTKILMADLRKIKGLEVIKVDTHKSVDAPKYMPVQVRLPDGKLHMLIESPSELAQHIHTLHQIVNAYKTRASLDRTSQTLVDSFKAIYPDLSALIVFPSFKIKTVLKLAGQNIVLPTGITRFTASPRALHLNYPLHELSSGKPIEYKEAYLQHWVQERIKNKGVRHYAEATFLFDE
jgi:L-serine kinase (ATP) / ParB family transcriptional regulator, heme-responsive regulator